MNVPQTPLGTLEAINQRASVRSYAPQKVDEATIRSLIAAAIRAPTAMHEEPWAFAVIQDVELLKKLSDRAKPLFLAEMQTAHIDRGGHSLSYFKSSEFNIFYNAGTLIVICGRLNSRFAIPDCWLAAGNLMLAACALGLGSCVIGSAVAGLNNQEVRSEFGIPGNVVAIAPIIIGVPAAPVGPAARKEPQLILWK